MYISNVKCLEILTFRWWKILMSWHPYIRGAQKPLQRFCSHSHFCCVCLFVSFFSFFSFRSSILLRVSFVSETPHMTHTHFTWIFGFIWTKWRVAWYSFCHYFFLQFGENPAFSCRDSEHTHIESIPCVLKFGETKRQKWIQYINALQFDPERSERVQMSNNR